MRDTRPYTTPAAIRRRRSATRHALLACLALLALIVPGVANAQGNPFLRISNLTENQVNNPRYQFYEFTYDIKGSSLWGPNVPGSQSLDLDLPITPPLWSQTLGAFYNPCWIIDCTFGAGIQAGISATATAGIHASADAGSVDLHCPVGVGIEFPKPEDVVPGQPATIQTWYYVEPTAYMNINAPHINAKLTGRLQAQIDLALVAEAFGHKFVNINLFNLLGLDSPSLDGQATLLDIGNLLPVGSDLPLPIPPNLGYGYFHLPNLSARGTLHNDTLTARAADNFLTLHGDVTNLLLELAAFGLPIPFNGHYDLAGFYVDFHLLDLTLDAALGVRQDFTFDPRPTVTFRTQYGETKTVRAGESVTFTAPLYSPLMVTPTISFDNNAFADAFSATFTPSLNFTLIQIAGGGRVAGHDLFSFNLNPFGTQTLQKTFDYPLFDQSFALPHPDTFTCAPYPIGGSSVLISRLTRRLSSIIDNNDIAGQLNGAILPTHLDLQVQGSRKTLYTAANVNADGSFSYHIPYYEVGNLGQYHPVTVIGSYPDPNNANATLQTNPVTVYWPRPPVDPTRFDDIAFDIHRLHRGQFVTYSGTGQFSLPYHSTNLEPDSTLLYDDVPIATQITRDFTVPDGYLLLGEIPDALLNRGGLHAISFLNSGVNQTPVLVKTILVNNTVPAVTDVVKKPSLADSNPALFVRGSGFTLDTSVSIGGDSRTVTLVAPTELSVSLLPADCTPGVHNVVVANPAPGGGSVSSSYQIAAPVADNPLLAARHSLLRHEPAETSKRDDDAVADTITITNTGQSDLRDVVVNSVNLLVNGKAFASSGLPKGLPFLHPGEYSSVQVVFPSHSTLAGDTAILQVRGTVHGKAFVLSSRATMPAYDPAL